MKSESKKPTKFTFVKASELIRKLEDENDKRAAEPRKQAKKSDVKNPK